MESTTHNNINKKQISKMTTPSSSASSNTNDYEQYMKQYYIKKYYKNKNKKSKSM